MGSFLPGYVIINLKDLYRVRVSRVILNYRMFVLDMTKPIGEVFHIDN